MAMAERQPRTSSREFHAWLIEQMDQIKALSKHPEPDELAWEWYSYIAEEAGDWAARFGWVELFEQCAEGDYFGEPTKLKALLSACIAACVAQRPTLPDGVSESNESVKENRELPERCEIAYRAYKLAEDKLGNITDKEAHAWLKGPHSDYGRKLEAFETWRRYLREARRFYDDRKNTPRFGRPHGKSIVTLDQISPSSNDD